MTAGHVVFIKNSFDYGAIIIPTNLGSTTGWFGFGVYSDADLTSAVGNISGYPGDKPSGTQWYDAHKIASVNNRSGRCSTAPIFAENLRYCWPGGSGMVRIPWQAWFDE